MSETILQPTIASDPDNSWIVESLALVQDGNGTQCEGSGKLILKSMDGRLSIPNGGEIVGIEIELWGSCPIPVLQNDSFTDTAGTLLKNHNGELNCDWQKPFTGATPAYQRINSSGRTYYCFENESGPTTNGSEHFTSNDVPPSNNYAVEAVFYSASVVGDLGEIYARASLPYTFYVLQYSQATSVWRLGKCNGTRTAVGQMTELGSWTMVGGIGVGQSATGRLEVNGSIIKAIIDGSERISVSDSSIASGFAGLRLDPGSGTGPSQRPGTPSLEAPIESIGGEGEDTPSEPVDVSTVGLQFQSFKVEEIKADSISVGLSIDGSTVIGNPKTLKLGTSNQVYTLGSPSDLWGTSLAPEDIRLDTFSVIIERTSSNVLPVVDFVQDIIYHTGSGETFTMTGMRDTARQRVQYGWETDLGTAVSAGKRLRAMKFIPQPNPEFKAHRPAGEKLESEHIVVKEWSTAAMTGMPCYNELGVALTAMKGLPVSSGTENQRISHFWRFENRIEQKGKPLTIEYGEDPSTIDVFGSSETFNRGERVKGFTLAELNMELSRGDATVSGNGFGHKIEPDHVMSTGVTDKQTFTITATGGSFKVRFNGSAWATINIPLANAAALDTALEALSTIGSGKLTITGTGPYVVEFSGSGFSGYLQPLFEVDASLATGGTVTVAHTRYGGITEYPIVALEPGHINIYLADSIAALSSNRMQRCSMLNFGLRDRFSPFWSFNRSNGQNFTGKTEGSNISARFSLKAHADSEATSLLGTARSNARKFLRIEAIGPLAYGSDYHEFILDAAVKVAAVGTMEDEEGAWMTNYELALTEDRAWGNSMTVWLKNLLAAADYQN